MATERMPLQAVAEKITDEGKDAYRLGVSSECNPYYGTRNAIYWLEGWKAERARVEREDVDAE